MRSCRLLANSLRIISCWRSAPAEAIVTCTRSSVTGSCSDDFLGLSACTGWDPSVRGFAASAERDFQSQGDNTELGNTRQDTGKGEDDICFSSSGELQPLKSGINYFKLMHQLENSFKLNHGVLDKRYKDLQRLLHPDRFSTKPQSQQDLSATASSFVNEAFQTLKDPLKRGEYMLGLQGEEIGEGTQTDPELLMTIMEARESIENTKDIAELQQFAKVFQRQQETCIQEIEEAFTGCNLDRAKSLLGVLKYLTNIQAAIQEKL